MIPDENEDWWCDYDVWDIEMGDEVQSGNNGPIYILSQEDEYDCVGIPECAFRDKSKAEE